MADPRSATADELAFTDMDLARVNLIRDLKDKMGVNDEGLDVVLHLVDQMHALRRALAARSSPRAIDGPHRGDKIAFRPRIRSPGGGFHRRPVARNRLRGVA